MNTSTTCTKGSWIQLNERRAARAGVLLLLLLLTLPSVVQAQFNYIITNGTVIITKYTGPGGAVTIPDTINGLPVVSIGANTFFLGTNLTSVTIPNSVTSIGDRAFFFCTSLTALYFGGNAPSLDGSNVFQGDSHATVYYMPGTSGWGTTFGGLPTALWPQPRPGAWTLSASSITTNSATLNGTVNPNGYTTSAWFQWGTTTNYGNLTSVTALGSGTTALSLSAPLDALTPGVTYHFRIAATNDYGLVYGSDQSFTTLGPPLVSTLPATGVSTNSATLNGTVTPNGWPTTAWFQWGATTNYGNLTSATALGSGAAALPLAAPLTGLTLGVTYHFRIAATNNYGLAYGSDQSFATESWAAQYTYTTNNGTITITGYTGQSGAVTIPDTIYGLPVTCIGTNAFLACTNLSSLTIPNSVTNIAFQAFAGCRSLINVTIGNSVITIGSGAFVACGSMTNITIPNSVTSIGYEAFEGCASLTSVTIPNGVTDIGYAAFSGTSLTNVMIPKSLTSIGAFPFANCTSLTAIAVDALNPAYCSVDGVLFNKSQTTLIQCPGGKAGTYTIPDGVTDIEWDAFYGCVNLTDIMIPTSLTSVGYEAFEGCSGLNSVTIPSSVTSIEDFAFAFCTNLTALHFGGNAPSLGGAYVFQGDNHATVYYLPGTTGWGTTFGGLPTALWQRQPPAAWTLSANSISTNSAVLNGTVNPNGYPTSAWFQWGATTNYGNLTSVTALGSGTTALPLSAPLGGLTFNATYHFRIAATNDYGLVYGSDQSFTTSERPQISTLAATGVSTNSATLNGTVNPNGWPTTAWFQWGTTTNYGNLTSVTNLGSGTTTLALAAPLAGLTPGVTYHFRIAATNDYGQVYGSDESFATVASPPQVSTLPATGVSPNSATLNGTVNPNGWSTTAWFQWGVTYSNLTAATALGSGTTALPLSVSLGGLTPGVTYHFRVAATNYNGVVYGSDQSFTTLGPSLVSTLPATGVSPNSATLNGTVNPIGSPTTAWFQWGTTANYGNLTSVTNLGSGTNALPLAAPLAGLTPGVTYHFRIAATNAYGLVYGNDQSFTTLGPPLVSTLPATGVPANGATLNGTINPNGYPTTAWFQWGTTTSYGDLTSVANLGSGTTALSLSAPLAELTPGVTYHFRVAATNAYGLAYGGDRSFTAGSLPGSITIAGTTYLRTGTPESVSVSFLIPDGGVTSRAYSGFVELNVSGVGECYFTDLNDAFYVYTDTQHNPTTPVNYGVWQLAVDSAPLIGLLEATIDARNYIYYDVIARTEVLPAYVPAYSSDHVYDFVINADLLPSGGLPCPIHFGICDDVFSDNWGGFSIIVQQLSSQVPPSILAGPYSQTAEAGGTVHFAVDTVGVPLPAYQWYFNGTNMLSCTSLDLVLTNILFSQAGTYTVVVTNTAGAVTSAPVMLNVIAAVERRPVPGVKVTGETASLWNVDYADSLSPAPTWTPLGSVSLTGTPQYCFDLTLPLPPQRSYRAWQSGTPGVRPSLDLHPVPAITLTGTIGGSVRLDYINRFGPTDAWVTLATVPLTNTSQLYFDISAPGQPPRLYRLVPSP